MGTLSPRGILPVPAAETALGKNCFLPNARYQFFFTKRLVKLINFTKRLDVIGVDGLRRVVDDVALPRVMPSGQVGRHLCPPSSMHTTHTPACKCAALPIEPHVGLQVLCNPARNARGDKQHGHLEEPGAAEDVSGPWLNA